ncbi:hypothetical protein MCO_00514 [Bartonella sp. DB5-6]|uniref:Vomp family autotransporter n=1 Tax=Bartonella sp. DB5-6 TaxID=1094755 RepID=UPI00026E9CCA|nr:Vomp family autotransporter [Bartonella sp. DB5-6]EJF79937.1 hypothetical protein MCO_00514 [Bartonella sp. DB5-6]
MKKLYSTSNLVKAVTLGAAVATLLSSVSPVFAANVSITGDVVRNTSAPNVTYPFGSHGSIVFAGDDNYCGVDNVIGRGGKQQQGIPDASRISAETQYKRFISNQEFTGGYHPYGTATAQEVWSGDGTTNLNGRPSSGYMGTFSTGGNASAMPEAYGIYSFATGCGSAATGNYSTVFGAGATAKAGGAQAFGVSALASGRASVAMGVGSEASGVSTVAIGGLATASGERSISIGDSSKATIDDAIAVGSNAEGSGINSVAVGKFASASGYNSIALGLKTKATDEYAVAIGSKAEAQALGSIAIGGGEPAENGEERKVIAKGKNSIAIGSHTYAEMDHSVAVGINAQVRVIDGVAVGGGSVSRIDKDTFGYDPVANAATTKSDLAWKSTAGDFSVGNTNQKLTRQITNVAAGSQDTDAVNVAQLKALRDVMAGAGGGWKISVNDGDSTDVTPSSTVDFSVKNDNLTIEKESVDNKQKIKFALSDTLELTSVTTGQSSMSDDGFIFANGAKITVDGIDAGDKQITNVADATENNQAVNYKQLKEVQKGIKTTWQLSVNGGDAMSVGPNEMVNLEAVSNNDKQNIKITKGENHDVKFDLADDINVMTVTAGESIMDAAGFRFEGGDGPSITVNGIHAGDKTIKGIAAGEEDTDAVNYKQLKDFTAKIKTGWKLAVEDEEATDIGAESTVKFVAAEDKDSHKNIKIEKDNNNKITFSLNDNLKLTSVTTGRSIVSDDGFGFKDNKGPRIAFEGISAGNKEITNVADGQKDTDAVNYKQLNEVRESISKAGGWKLAVNGGTAVDILPGKTVNFVGAELKNYENKNIKIVSKDDNTVEFDLNDFIEVGRVQTGKTQLSDNGVVITGGPRITWGGVHAGNKQITGVAKGVLDNDAVNLAQLNEVKNEIAGNTLIKWDEGQKLITIGKEKDGTKIDITGSEGDRIIAGVKDAVNDNEAVNKKQLDNTVTNINNNIKKVNDFAVLYDKNDDESVNYNSVTLGNNQAGEQVALHNVKSGEISANSTDAINGSQINKISGDIANYFGGNASFENGVFKNPRYNLTTIDENSQEEQKEYNDVGTALSGLDMNIRHVNQHLVHAIGDIANYFGGGAGYDESGDWHAPIFKVVEFKPDGTSSKQPYSNVAEAFEGVNNSFNAIHNQISDITENSLVKWDEGQKLITIGKEKGGTRIDITGSEGVRTIAGVKEAVNNDEAVNKGQLDKSIEKISNDINIASASAVLYDKDANGEVNYNSVTLGGGRTENPVALLNVKDGDISANSTDAINGGQINKISGDIANYFGGGASFENGVFKGPKYSLSVIVEDGAVAKANFYDVGSALTGLDKNVKSVNQRVTNVINDFTQEIQGLSKDALLWSEDDQAFVALHGKDKEKTNSKLKFLLDGDISKGSTDAITGNQLYLMSNQLANYFGGGAKYENGQWTAPNFQISQVNADGTVGEKTYNNVSEAFGGINNGMSNINNRIDEIKNNIDSDVLHWNKDKGAYDASHNGQASKIINVADGKIAKDSKEAVNGGQLWQTNERITGVEKDIKHIEHRVDNISSTVNDIGETVYNIENKVDNIENTVTNLSDGVVFYDKDENGKKTNKVTLIGGDPSEPVMIDNVADGKIETGSKEAVNGGQLHDYTQQQMKIILDESKHYTDQRVNNIVIDAIDDAVERANNYTNMKFEALSYSIENVRKEARQAAAIGLAVSNLRYNETPGKLSVAFGSGLWRSQSAFAFGAGYTSESGHIHSNVSVTSSGGHWGVGAGFNMTLN